MNQPWTDNNILALATLVIVELLALTAAVHAVMTKRDPRSAAGWTVIVLFAPVIGTLLYWLFGINSIERRAKKIYPQLSHDTIDPEELGHPNPELGASMRRLSSVSARMSGLPLRSGNIVSPLINGEEAYPEMLKAIRKAKTSVVLSTYIFDNDDAGKMFAQALIDAGARGVKVRVLVDDIGSRYSFPTIISKLKGENLQAKRFHRALLPWFFNYSQLRSHRKLLIVDDEVGFIGGMNIRAGHLVSKAKEEKKTQDIHFMVKGPVLEDLMEIFAQDWKFTTKEPLDISSIHPPYRSHEGGQAFARAMPNGPKENLGQHRWTMLGAISVARTSIQIATPYFLPDQELISALGTAALQGVKVEIILPAKNNHALAHWACMANLWQVLETGCQVYLSPPPFDHSKLFIVDGRWSFLGSSNWDARSYRLNFELNIECYHQPLAEELSKVFEDKKRASRPVTHQDLKERSVPVKLRDGIARLFTPYL